MSDDLNPVSVEQDGRILTGTGGVTTDRLEDTMARHAPPESEPPAESTTPPTDKPKRGQARFAELRARAESAEKERDEWKARTESAQRPAVHPAPVSAPPAPASDAARPRESAAPARSVTYPDGLKTFEAFLSANPGTDPSSAYEAWRDAREDFREQARETHYDTRIRAGIDADRESRTRTDHVSALVERGRTAYADFDAVRQAVADIMFPQATLNTVIGMDGSEHVIYQLAKDRALATRIASMTDPMQIGMALQRLVPAAAGVVPASPAPTGLSIVPPPYQPVGGGSKTTIPSSGNLVKGFDFDSSGYRERRAAERGGRKR